MTEEQIKHMADRFLGWRLPEDFRPDCGIHFDADAAKKLNPRNGRYEPVGTNLFSAAQAAAMVRHMAEGMPNARPPRQQPGDVGKLRGALETAYRRMGGLPMLARSPEGRKAIIQIAINELEALSTLSPTEGEGNASGEAFGLSAGSEAWTDRAPSNVSPAMAEALSNLIELARPFMTDGPQRLGLAKAEAALSTIKTFQGAGESVPDDVARLVVAARIVAHEDRGAEALNELDQASEAFASRVRWDDQPDADATCEGDDPAERCMKCDCWKLTREMCS